MRVSVSPECREPGHLDPTNPEEWGWLDRDTGVVVCVADENHRQCFPGGHWYGVEMDDGRDLWARITGRRPADRVDVAPDDWYAASELEAAEDVPGGVGQEA